MKTQNKTIFLDIKLKDYEKEFLEKIGFESIANYIKPHQLLFKIFTEDIEDLVQYEKEEKEKGIIIWYLNNLKGNIKWFQDNNLAYGILENYLLRFQKPLVLCGKKIVNEGIKKIGKKKFNRSEGWERYREYLYELYLKIKEYNPDIIFLKDIELISSVNDYYFYIYLIETLWQINVERKAHLFLSVIRNERDLPSALIDEAIIIRNFASKRKTR
jgi:hypothetical protein